MIKLTNAPNKGSTLKIHRKCLFMINRPLVIVIKVSSGELNILIKQRAKNQ
jgi:hypothetical protein